MNSIPRSKYLQILTLLLVAQAVLFYSASHGESTPLPAPLKQMPTSFGPWRMMAETEVDDETKSVLKADDLLNREFSAPEGRAN